jgi:phosphate transport system permease protein
MQMSGDVLAPPPASGPAIESAEPEDFPRRLVVRHSFQDRLFVHSVRGVGMLVLVIVSCIGVFLGIQSVPTLDHYGWSFFTEFRWLPSQDVIGISAVVVGTIEVALLALVIAVPLSVLTALFITDWAPPWLRPTQNRSGA